MSETQLLATIRQALAIERGLVVWRNNSGAAMMPGRGGTRQRVSFGLARGASDLIGILAPSGRLIALEIKTPTGRVAPHQRLFLDLIRRHGGFAAVVRSVDEARAAVARARAGESA